MSDTVNKFLKPSSTLTDGQIGNGANPGSIVNLRTYDHAKRIFIDSNYRLSPKYSFLFYVEFDLNPGITQLSGQSQQEMGMVVKSVGLPKFTVDNKIQNAYNRVNVVQTKMKYDQITINFHDDQGDVIRNFWYDYYSFFYRDSDYSDTLYTQRSKYTARPVTDWGYGPRPVPSYRSGYSPQDYQYIQAIRIYSMYQKNFSEYTLINPTITAFKHGDHDNAQNEIMHNEMTVAYEAVKYKTGYVTPNSMNGFVNLHYDNRVSPIATEVGSNIIINAAGNPATPPGDTVDLASNNVHPGEMANNPLNTIAGFGSSLAGGLINGLTGQIGSALGGLVSGGLGSLTGGAGLSGLMSGGLGSLTSGFSIPSLGDIGSGLTSKLSSAADMLEGKVAGMSASIGEVFSLGQAGPASATAGVNFLKAAESTLTENLATASSAMDSAKAMIPSLTSGATQLASGASAQLSSIASKISIPAGDA